jgi:hypothetical protein
VVFSLNVSYGSAEGDKKLDIYSIPLDPISHRTGGHTPLNPVMVFLPPQIRPLPSQKIVFSSLGANLAEHLGLVVVIPDLTQYPNGRVRDQVDDAKRVLQWVMNNIERYGGDPNRIYLSGHGIGAHLALLIPIQDVVVQSRENYLTRRGARAPAEDLPNGVMDVKVCKE